MSQIGLKGLRKLDLKNHVPRRLVGVRPARMSEKQPVGRIKIAQGDMDPASA